MTDSMELEMLTLSGHLALISVFCRSSCCPDICLIYHFVCSDGQRFDKYQQNKQSPPISNTCVVFASTMSLCKSKLLFVPIYWHTSRVFHDKFTVCL